MKRQLPNILSASRIVAAFVILVCVLIDQPVFFLIATILFVLASITDYFDGYLARRFSLISALGIFLDTTADKVFVAAILTALVQVGLVPAWLVAIIVTREFLVMGLRTVAAAKGNIIPAGPWGKQKTFITMVAMIMVLLAKSLSAQGLSLFPLALAFNSHTVTFPNILLLVADIGLLVALFWTIMSGVEYFIDALPVFRPGYEGKNS
jgi:CDP-diacylglycerol---glycerol-3-phosphate 3-phosphatidyltransferase